MTMFPTPAQEAQSIREGLEFALRRSDAQIIILEKLIRKYAYHVKDCEGVTFLENQFGNEGMFNPEEWAEIRRIAGVLS